MSENYFLEASTAIYMLLACPNYVLHDSRPFVAVDYHALIIMLPGIVVGFLHWIVSE